MLTNETECDEEEAFKTGEIVTSSIVSWKGTNVNLLLRLIPNLKLYYIACAHTQSMKEKTIDLISKEIRNS